MELNIFKVPSSNKGIYFLMDSGSIVYVGQTHNIHNRISKHISENKKKFDSYGFIPSDSECMLEEESFYIFKYNPKYNKKAGGFINIDTMLKNAAKYIGAKVSKKDMKKAIEELEIDCYDLNGIKMYSNNSYRKILKFIIADMVKNGGCNE